MSSPRPGRRSTIADRNDDLRATGEAIHRDAERIQTIEETKAALEPDDPRLVRLSEQVERVASDLRSKAAAERELSEDSQATG